MLRCTATATSSNFHPIYFAKQENDSRKSCLRGKKGKKKTDYIWLLAGKYQCQEEGSDPSTDNRFVWACAGGGKHTAPSWVLPCD